MAILEAVDTSTTLSGEDQRAIHAAGTTHDASHGQLGKRGTSRVATHTANTGAERIASVLVLVSFT